MTKADSENRGKKRRERIQKSPSTARGKQIKKRKSHTPDTVTQSTHSEKNK